MENIYERMIKKESEGILPTGSKLSIGNVWERPSGVQTHQSSATSRKDVTTFRKNPWPKLQFVSLKHSVRKCIVTLK